MSPEKMFVSHQGLIFKIIFDMLQDYEDARDLLQDVFLRLRRSTDKGTEFENEYMFKTWITTVAKNMTIDFLRKKKTHRISEYRLDSKELDPEMRMILTETLERVEKGIENLYPNQREVLKMRVEKDTKFKDIAEITGRKMSTVLADMRYARINLKKTL